MQVLMIHNRYRVRGGEDSSTEAQVSLLESAGHRVRLLEDSNRRIDDLGSIRTAARSAWSREAYAQVSSALQEDRFDVVHVQNFFPLFSPSVYYAARKHGVPVVQSLRNFRILCPEGMLQRNGRVCTDCTGRRVAWPGVLHRCYRGSSAATGAVAAVSAGHRLAGTWSRMVNRYATPSDYAKRVFVDAGWRPESIVTVPNFVFPDYGAGAGQGGFVLFAGRLTQSKGVDILLDAWRLGGFEIPLVIVGEGPLKPLVRAAANADPLIEYRGVATPDEVLELLGDARLVVIPTRGIETFGRVAAEAASRGTPAVVAGHGGLLEIVTHGVDGLTFPPGDTAALVDRIRTLLADPAQLDAMRSAARANYLRRFNGVDALDKWVSLYREVAAGK